MFKVGSGQEEPETGCWVQVKRLAGGNKQIKRNYKLTALVEKKLGQMCIREKRLCNHYRGLKCIPDSRSKGEIELCKLVCTSTLYILYFLTTVRGQAGIHTHQICHDRLLQIKSPPLLASPRMAWSASSQCGRQQLLPHSHIAQHPVQNHLKGPSLLPSEYYNTIWHGHFITPVLTTYYNMI